MPVGEMTDDREREGLLHNTAQEYQSFAAPKAGARVSNEDEVHWLKDYLTADIDTRWADLILIVCFLIAGLIDSGAYNAYECFTSMQVR